MLGNNKKTFLKFVGILQLIGGFFGVYGFGLDIGYSISHLIFLSLLTLSFTSAYYLLTDDNKGEKLAVINFFIQFVDFELPDIIAFKYDLGLHFNLGINLNNFETILELGIQTLYYFEYSNVSNNLITINFFAITILALLLKSGKNWPKDPFGVGGWS